MKQNTLPMATATLALILGPIQTWAADPASRLRLVDFPGSTATQNWGINSRGDIVGYYTDANKNSHGFLVNGTKFTSIDYPGSTLTYLNGVSPQGDIVGQFRETATSPYRGFRLGADGVMSAYDLPGAASTWLEGINSSGAMAGGYTTADGAGHTFLLDGDQVTKIDFPGATLTGPLGISPQGEVVGAYSANNVTHGYIWSSGGGFTTIDYPKATYTNVTGRNGFGDTVGRYLDSAGVSHAYLLSNGQFSSFDCPNATFTGATAIDPDGNIVGRCQINGVFHGFVYANGKPVTRYAVRDLGLVGPPPGQPLTISNNGLVAGLIVTADNYQHAALWSGAGVMTDLGRHGLNSEANAANDSGVVVGAAEFGGVDPGGEDFCGIAAQELQATGAPCVPFVMQHGAVEPLRTLGGANGVANFVNNRGQIVGQAENTTVDPTCPAPQRYQFRPVVWGGNGRLEELPIPASDRNGVAYRINEYGDVVGGSGECAAFNIQYPFQPLHALLWQSGRMVDLGNLGGKGTLLGHFAEAINNNSEITGNSDLAGDKASHAFRWTKLGGMEDLGVLPGDAHSLGLAISDSGVIVGISLSADFNEFRPFIWRAGVMTDLNSLIPSTSALYLLTACFINARGEIIGFAADAEGNLHGYLAAPLTPGAGEFETGAHPVAPTARTRANLSRLAHLRLSR